ncbi:hypothetical protein GCM10022245_34820 [Streptomyces mayteni]
MGSPYLCGNEHLGPWPLPTADPATPLLAGYHPLGGLQDHGVQYNNGFLELYRRTDKDDWRYPPLNGFTTTVEGQTITADITPKTLEFGDLVDRFGPPSGRFLSPAGVLFAERALPPDALNPVGDEHHVDYHCYEVRDDITVEAGSARPWFDQPGGGAQYRSADHRVSELLDLGLLWEIAEDICASQAAAES